MLIHVASKDISPAINAEDFYDLKKGIREYLQVYKEMVSWCKGYATRPEHAVALMWYAQEQGRNMCDDYQLISEFKNQDPDFSKVNLHVPWNIFYKGDPVRFEKHARPHDNGTLTKDGYTQTKDLYKCETMVYPVGHWTGNDSSPYFLMAASKHAPYTWDFGHCCNVLQDGNASGFHTYKGGGLVSDNDRKSNTFLREPFVKNMPP